MADLNILNRACFEESSVEITATIKAGQTSVTKHPLGNGQIFCLNEIAWRYGIDGNQQDNYGWPRAGMRISIEDVFKDRVESPYRASPPKLLNKINISVLNPSGIDVKVHFTLKGTLVSSRLSEPLSYKEILGYILLNDNQKGILALSEVISEKQSLPMETILTSLAGGNIGSLSDANQASLPIKALELKSTPSLADSESLLSLMIGDLVTMKTSNSLKLEQIQEIANHLIHNKHWYR